MICQQYVQATTSHITVLLRVLSVVTTQAVGIPTILGYAGHRKPGKEKESEGKTANHWCVSNVLQIVIFTFPCSKCVDVNQAE